MTPTITIDTTAFSNALQKLAENSRKCVADIVKQEAGLFAEAAARGTPPSGRRPMMTTWEDAKRIGTNRIKSQAGKAFKPLFDQPEIAGDPKLIRKLRYLISHDKMEAAKKVVTEKGVRFAEILDSLTESIYNQYRNKKGKVYSPVPVMVSRAASISKVVREKIRHLGAGKSGWSHAMALAGRKFPSWIASKNGSGWAKEIGGFGRVVWQIADSVSHIQDAGENKRIIERTYEFRRKRMEMNLQKALERAVKQK